MAPRPITAIAMNWPTRRASWALVHQAVAAHRSACAKAQAFAGLGASQLRSPSHSAPSTSARAAAHSI
eukprot:10503830-Lingulodinium_polyedra.AAC.1